jgi:hypothetical protein
VKLQPLRLMKNDMREEKAFGEGLRAVPLAIFLA